MIVNFKDRIAAGSIRYGPWQRRAGRPKTNNDCTTANEFVEIIDASPKEGLATKEDIKDLEIRFIKEGYRFDDRADIHNNRIAETVLFCRTQYVYAEVALNVFAVSSAFSDKPLFPPP